MVWTVQIWAWACVCDPKVTCVANGDTASFFIPQPPPQQPPPPCRPHITSTTTNIPSCPQTTTTTQQPHSTITHPHHLQQRQQVAHCHITQRPPPQTGQKVRNKCLKNSNGGHDIWEAVFMPQGPCSLIKHDKLNRKNMEQPNFWFWTSTLNPENTIQQYWPSWFSSNFPHILSQFFI